MRLFRPALTALLIGAAAPALVAPAFAQTCACPPAEGAMSGPVTQAEEPPPPFPEYDQPPIPAPGYIWTPGYWAWNSYDYYWVPGVWVPPPQPGFLWTPAYWAFVGGVFLFHQGYWGPHIGFYGGINYGYGYNGLGYEGGRWEANRFVYNTTVNNFGNVRITNVYTQNVAAAAGAAARVSYNGGPGGVAVRPTPEQERLTTEERLRPTQLQVTQARTASMEATQFHSANQGKPAIAATERPGEFKGPGAVPAKPAGSAAIAPNAPLPPAGEQKPAPALERRLPSGATLPPVGQPGAPAPAPKPSLGERPTGTEQLNAPKVQEKIAPKEAPRANLPPPAEAPVRPRVAPGAERITPPKVAPKPQELQRPPAPQLMQGQAAPPPRMQPRPGPAPQARPARENKPERRGAECGKPGLPPCR